VIYLSAFLLSVSLLALEITWIRLLEFQQWAHVASMVISLALLGFAASAIYIVMCRSSLQRNWYRHYEYVTYVYAFSIPLTFFFLQRIPLDPFRLLWEFRQWIYFLGCCLLLFFPFFLGAVCIGMLFCVERLSIARVYFSNLFGSGVGVLAALGLMFLFPLKGCLVVIAVVGLTAAWLSPGNKNGFPWRRICLGIILASSLLIMWLTPSESFPTNRLSEHCSCRTSISLKNDLAPGVWSICWKARHFEVSPG